LPFNVDGHDVVLALSPDDRYALVADVSWAQSTVPQISKPPLTTLPVPLPLDRSHPPTLAGNNELVVEIFDLSAGSSLGSQIVAHNVLSPAGGFAGGVAVVAWSSLSGPRQTQVATIPLAGNPASAIAQAPPVVFGSVAPLSSASANAVWVQALGISRLATVNSAGKVQILPVFGDGLASARPFPTSLFILADERLLVVNPGIPAAARIDPVSGAVDLAQELASRPGSASGTLQSWSADIDSDYLYVADTSPLQGGIWVYSLTSLALVDRWLSTTSFAALRCANDGVLFAVANSQPTILIINQGAIQSATELTTMPSYLF
jgi:hypothetical protein